MALQAAAQGQATSLTTSYSTKWRWGQGVASLSRYPVLLVLEQRGKAPEGSHFPSEYFTRALQMAAAAPAAMAALLTLSVPPQDMLMQLAKAVANAAAALVLKAKNVAQKTEDATLQTQVIAAATQCALSTSQLVACTKVSSKVNPYLSMAVSFM